MAISAIGLRLVHGNVNIGEQRREVISLERIRRNPDRRGQGQQIATERHFRRESTHRVQGLFGQGLSIISQRVGHMNCKLIATQPIDARFALLDQVAQDAADGNE